MFKIQLGLRDQNILVDLPYNPLDVEKIKALPQRRFDGKAKVWVVPADRGTLQLLCAIFGDRIEMPGEVRKILEAAEALDVEQQFTRAHKEQGTIPVHEVPVAQLINPVGPDGLPQRFYDPQVEALALGARRKGFGYFMDQGTGKTPTVLGDAVWAWRRGEIELLILLTLNNVKPQIVDLSPAEGDVDEVTKFVPSDVPVNRVAVYAQPSAKQKADMRTWEFNLGRKDCLHIMVIHYEALTVDRLYQMLLKLVTTKATMIAADESTRIKAPPKRHRRLGPQNRSARAIELARHCVFRRIMTGTPVIKRPLDAWSQLLFLDTNIWPWPSFTAFKMHFCQLGGYHDRQVLFYKNLDDLVSIIAGISYRVSKEHLGLPDKVYAKRQAVVMAPPQKAAYEKMRQEALLVLDGQARVKDVDDIAGSDVLVSAPIVLTQMLRLQQITSGYLPVTDADGNVVDHIELVPPAQNPKLQRALEIIEDAGDQKVVVWGRFRHELASMCALLTAAGIKHVEFHGGIDDAARVAARKAFQTETAVRVFVGNPAAGGTGLNLQAGSVVIYLSNDFSTENRVQSEDRCHRIGQHRSVTYYDIVVPGTIDIKVLSTLRQNKSISDVVMRDDPKEWI